jgi:magnesium transporter
MAQALLFDRDRTEEVDEWGALVDRLGRKSLLWIDLYQPGDGDLDDLSTRLELSRETRERLASHDDEPYFGDFDAYLHVRAYAPCATQRADLSAIDCLVSEHWLVTVHHDEVEVIETFRHRATESAGETGRLDGLEFLATLLEWVLHAYFESFDKIEDELAELDSSLLESLPADPATRLPQLVGLRREIRELRAALVSHRELFLALARPELAAIADSKHAHRFAGLQSRLADTVQSARDCRDSAVGSFDVLIARTEQRTNEIVKVLTLASMLFLPGALIAAVLGMNFKVGLFQYESLFWVVTATIVALMAVVLVAARLRRWI